MTPRLRPQAARPRRVGIEIEFGGIDAQTAAQAVRAQFGGAPVEEDPHRVVVRGAAHGDWVVELDSAWAHPKGKSGVQILREFEKLAAEVVGDISTPVVPYEITTPPLPADQLPALDQLMDRLVQAGAEGTQASALFAFGLHLNPEIRSEDAGQLVRTFQAWLLLADWMRERLGADRTRQMMGFCERFPEATLQKMLRADYTPNLARFMEDYLADNPTRNRDMDLLPLFTKLDPARVRAHVPPEVKVRPRPTFHVRIFDSRLGDPAWRVSDAWAMWKEVEALADDPARLHRMMEAWQGWRASWFRRRSWAEEARRLLLQGPDGPDAGRKRGVLGRAGAWLGLRP